MSKTVVMHTPGPWRVKNGRVETSDRYIAAILYAESRVTNEDKANARLIAAAPEMLVALKALCDADASYWGNEIRIACADHGDAIKRMRIAREAIAKAEG
jgi:hypothetical protein